MDRVKIDQMPAGKSFAKVAKFFLECCLRFRDDEPMPKLAYLGPEGSYSHELAITQFSSVEHIPYPKFSEVVESVASSECEIGLIPFYNTTRLSIEESQIELVNHAGKVFVTDVLPLNVKHCLGGFGQLGGVREFRSKEVVFLQVSQWLAENGFEAISQRHYPSTSAAIQSLSDDGKPAHSASIGAAKAFRKYSVPVLKRNIHNKPNVTLFFALRHGRPEFASAKHLLMCLQKCTPDDRVEVEQIVSGCGCHISSDWSVTLKKNRGKEAYFFEIDGKYSSLGLTSAVSRLKNKFKNTFVLGGYADKCITRLLWQPN